MLTWDDEVTSTASLLSLHSLPATPLAERSANHSALSAPVTSEAFRSVSQPTASRTAAPSLRRVNAADKRIINGETDVNQRVPFKYKWAWEKHLSSCANQHATQTDLGVLFPNKKNPFPWMNEMSDLKKERNFFETRVIEYQSGAALSWD